MSSKLNKVGSQPRAPVWQPPYSVTSTFARLTYLPEPLKGEADIAVLGIPWDGLVTYRPGTRFGPNEIRQSSVAVRSFSHHMNISVFEDLQVVDVGDIDVSSCDFNETFIRIESKIKALQKNGILVLSLGGDHSILLPALRALKSVHSDFTLIQFDAHTDTSETYGSARHHHGTCVRDAIEEGLILGSDIFQIGIRGTFGSAEYLDYGDNKKINVLDMHQFHDRLLRKDFIDKILNKCKNRPCYITFDIDSVDPAFAPGTGTPVPGGFTSFEVIDLLRSLRGLNIVGADVVEVAPCYDSNAKITSLLGCNIALQLLALMAISKKDQRQQVE